MYKSVIRRFLFALQYFKIAWRQDSNMTYRLVKQAKEDGMMDAHMVEFFMRKYFAEDHQIQESYKDHTYTIKITEAK